MIKLAVLLEGWMLSSYSALSFSLCPLQSWMCQLLHTDQGASSLLQPWIQFIECSILMCFLQQLLHFLCLFTGPGLKHIRPTEVSLSLGTCEGFLSVQCSSLYNANAPIMLCAVQAVCFIHTVCNDLLLYTVLKCHGQQVWHCCYWLVRITNSTKLPPKLTYNSNNNVCESILITIHSSIIELYVDHRQINALNQSQDVRLRWLCGHWWINL